jgi:catechol 2,3-dioxygenase-like lactoylglutathione lyase family enzyme
MAFVKSAACWQEDFLMAKAFIEHVNITVSDAEKTAERLVDLLGWYIRWRGSAQSGGHTVHVGTDTHYLAVWSPLEGQASGFAKGTPLNHIGIEVDDIDAIEAKVVSAGLTPFNHASYEPGRRFYFFDKDGIEFEIISYQ